MKRNQGIALLSLAALGLGLLLAGHDAHAQTTLQSCVPPAAGTGVLDRLAGQFSLGTSGWMSRAQGYAREIFGGLAVLEFAWAGAQYTLQKHDLGELIVSVLFKVMALAFFFMLITEAPTWIPAIVNSFIAMGQGIGGSTPLPTLSSGMISPSAVMYMGTCLAGNVMDLPAPPGLLGGLAGALAAVAAAIFVVIGFGLAALQLVVTEIESYIVIGAGAVMLGFLGSRWTSSWGEKYFGYAVSVGVKLMVVYLVVGLGETLST